MSKTIKEIITEEFLTCNICMDPFQNPKILKCLHTFCEACIMSTIQHQRLNTKDNISCPICRTTIESTSHEELQLQTNFPVKNLLEMVQGSSNNECFIELYRVKAGLNLDRAQAVAIAEKSHCSYLQSNIDELQTALTDLRRELTEEKSNCYQLEVKIYELQSVVSDLRREITEERKRVSYLQNSNTALQASTSDIGRQLSQEKKRNSDLQKGNNTLQVEIINLQRQQAEYKKQLKTEKDVNVKLKEELAEIDQTVDHMRKVQKDLEKVVDKQKNVSVFSWMINQCMKYIEMSVSWLPVWFKNKRGEDKGKKH